MICGPKAKTQSVYLCLARCLGILKVCEDMTRERQVSMRPNKIIRVVSGILGRITYKETYFILIPVISLMQDVRVFEYFRVLECLICWLCEKEERLVER